MDSMLNGLILGEALLNDAVAVVLSNAIENYIKISLDQARKEKLGLTNKQNEIWETKRRRLLLLFFFSLQGDSFEWEALLHTLLRFFTIVVGSIALGFLVSALTALLTKFTKYSRPHLRSIVY